MTWLRRNLFDILDIVKFIGILLLVLMFIHFNTAIAAQTQETQDIAASTNRVVKSQKDILQAIKQVTDDTRITASQQTAIIICMLQVPIQNRTTDLQQQCRSQAASVVSTASPPKVVQAPAPMPQSQSTTAAPSSSSSPVSPASSPSPVSTPKSTGLLKQVINFLGL